MLQTPHLLYAQPPEKMQSVDEKKRHSSIDVKGVLIIRRPLFGNPAVLFRIRGFAPPRHHGFAIV